MVWKGSLVAVIPSLDVFHPAQQVDMARGILFYNVLDVVWL